MYSYSKQELLDPTTGNLIIDSNSQAIIVKTSTNYTALGYYHFSQPSGAPNGYLSYTYASSGTLTSEL